MVVRLFCDANADMLEATTTHIADWDAANTTVQRTIKAISQVMEKNTEHPEGIAGKGLDVSIRTIENNLERMEAVHKAAGETLYRYNTDTVGGIPVKKARSYAFSALELIAWSVGLISQTVDNFKDGSESDNALKWLSWTCYGSAAALSRLKERYLQNWGKDEQTIGDLKALHSKDDVIPSVRGTCEILRLFSRSVNPDIFVQEGEWPVILTRIKQMPQPYRDVLSPKRMQSMCLKTENFQQVEQAIIEEEARPSTESMRSTDVLDGSPSPPAAARGLSASPPVCRPDTPRGRLLMMVEKIRAQRDAAPLSLPPDTATGLHEDYKTERTERAPRDETVIGADLEAGGGAEESHL